MPTRSTLIQRVVFQIHRQLAAGARVEESAFLTDRASGAQREVDIVVRRQVADHEVVVSIECRDRHRPATVEWVEQMAMKHSTLVTSKLVLVSRSGFSKQALAKAAQLGVDTYSLGEAAASDWHRLLGNNETGSLAVWALRIRACWLVLAGSPDSAHPAHPDTVIFRADGTVEGGLGQLIYSSIEGAPEFSEGAIEFASKVKEHEFLADMARENPTFVLANPGQLREVALIRVLLQAEQLPERFQLHQARYRGAPVAYGETESPAGRLTISLLQPEEGSPIGTVSVAHPQTGDVSGARVYFPESSGKLKFVTGAVRLPRAARPNER